MELEPDLLEIYRNEATIWFIYIIPAYSIKVLKISLHVLFFLSVICKLGRHQWNVLACFNVARLTNIWPYLHPKMLASEITKTKIEQQFHPVKCIATWGLHVFDYSGSLRGQKRVRFIQENWWGLKVTRWDCGERLEWFKGYFNPS